MQGKLKPVTGKELAFQRANTALMTLRGVLPKGEYDTIETQTIAALCRAGIAEVSR